LRGGRGGVQPAFGVPTRAALAGSRTILKLTFWVCGTHLSTLERAVASSVRGGRGCFQPFPSVSTGAAPTGSRTILKLTSWVRGTNLSTLERREAQIYQVWSGDHLSAAGVDFFRALLVFPLELTDYS